MEEELSGLLIDYATTSLGCISCIAEAGQHDDPHAIDVHESLILIALETLRMVTPDALTSKRERPRDVASDASGSRAGRYYDVRERVPIRDTSFEMQPNASAFQPVAARRTVVARERLLPRTTDHSGLLFLPNRQLSRRVGDDGFFVIAHVGQVWLGLSAWLRRRQSLHHWLPRVLPGVRRRDGDPHALLIAPEYAAVLRRETLHLLGYRLTRWSHIPYMPSYQRIWTTAVDIVRSVSGIIAGVFRGGERRALPEERDTDWIARRRVLDVSLPCAINATDPGQPKGMTP